MSDVLHSLLDAWRDGSTTGLATVVRTFSSAPQPPGARMMVRADLSVEGSVSGGCIEGALWELAQDVVAERAARLQRYGISTDNALSVGLTCGGTIDVFVEPVDRRTFPLYERLVADVDAEVPVALATVIEHVDPERVGAHVLVRRHDSEGTLGISRRADEAVADDARGLLAAGETDVLVYGPDGERRGDGMRVFVQSWSPRPRMVILGAVDFAGALSRQAGLLGYSVTVCDARPVFATPARFPEADEVVAEWPDRWLAQQVAAGRVDDRTVICVLTHDPKFDVPVLEIALRLRGAHAPAFIGAMGSRATHALRLERLRGRGLTEEELARLSSPIGLDLGGRTPQETALSIAAEIVAMRWGGTGGRLSRMVGPIHVDVGCDIIAPLGEPG